MIVISSVTIYYFPLIKVDSDEEDVEIELVEEEAPFLKGHGRHLNDLSPVRIVKNPDGSLAQVSKGLRVVLATSRRTVQSFKLTTFQAAMMQGALSKERREQKMMERQVCFIFYEDILQNFFTHSLNLTRLQYRMRNHSRLRTPRRPPSRAARKRAGTTRSPPETLRA